MNFSIKQDRLRPIMFKYLDSVSENNKVKNLDGNIRIYNVKDGGDIRDITIFMEYDIMDTELNIYTYFRNQFLNVFPIGRSDADGVISEWFSEKFDVPVSNTL